MVSLAGIPPTGGFWAKFLIFQVAIERGGIGTALAVVMVVNSVISLYYYLAVPKQMLFEDPDQRPAIARRRRLITWSRRPWQPSRWSRSASGPSSLAHFPPLSTLVGRLGTTAARRGEWPARTLRGPTRRMRPMIGLNRIKTWVLIAALGGLFVLIGARSAAERGFHRPRHRPGLQLLDVLVQRQDRHRDHPSKPVTEQEYPELYRMVRELTQTNRMPMPRIYVSDMTQPNAFATGRNPEHAAVSVTKGILQILDERELRGSSRTSCRTWRTATS